MRIQTTYCNHTNNPNTTEIRFNPSYERIIIQTLFRTHHSARQLTCFCTKYMRHQFCFQKNTYFLNNKHNSTRDTLHAHKHFKLLFSWNHTCHVYLTEIPGEKFQIFIQRGRNMKFLSVFCFFCFFIFIALSHGHTNWWCWINIQYLYFHFDVFFSRHVCVRIQFCSGNFSNWLNGGALRAIPNECILHSKWKWEEGVWGKKGESIGQK